MSVLLSALVLFYGATSAPSIFPPDYMLQLLVISADQGKVVYLRCSYSIPLPSAKPGRCIDAGREDGKSKGGHKGNFISTVSLYIVRKRLMREMKRTDNLAAVKRDITLN